MSVEISHLRRFLTVAEELHFTRAAERLYIAQPALSASIRKLEAHLQLELLHRNTRSVELTEAGRAFADVARDAVDSYDRALWLAGQLRGSGGGRVTLGVYNAAGSEIKRAIINRLREIDPDVDLTLVSESTFRLVQSTNEGTIDLGLCLAPIGTGQLRRILVGQEPMLAVLPRDHALAQSDSLRLEDLREEEWILPGSQTSREQSVLVRLCAEAGFKAQISEAVSDFDEDFAGVAGGRGVTAVPAGSLRRKTHEDVVFVPITGVRSPLYLVSRPDNQPSGIHSVIQAVIDVKGDKKGTRESRYV